MEEKRKNQIKRGSPVNYNYKMSITRENKGTKKQRLKEKCNKKNNQIVDSIKG